MSRNNKLTAMAFAEIAGSGNKVSSYDMFLTVDGQLSIPETPELKECKRLYLKILEQHKSEINDLAKLEETIVQLRCREMIASDLKVSVVREYIYARTTFYRNGNDVKDIRVLVGRVENFHGKSPEELSVDPDFIELSTKKLRAAMAEDIRENMSYVKSLKQKYNGKIG